MKKIISLAIIASAAMGLNAKSVEMPWYEGTNNSILDVSAVETTDTATIITFHIKYRPGWWVKFSKESVIKADGKEYALRWGDGIVPEKEFYLPESGDATVKLGFEAIPAETSSITFSEKSPSGWTIWGIDLTGTKKDGEVPAGLPAELIDPAGTPKTGAEIGETSLTFHLLGHEDATNDEYQVILNKIVGGQSAHKLIFDKETMQSKPWTFTQYGPAQMFVIHNDRSLNNKEFIIAPGENLDIYIDPSSSGIINRLEHRAGSDAARPLLTSVYYNGQYSAEQKAYKPYDRWLQQAGSYNEAAPDYTLTADEYVTLVLKNYYKYEYKIAGLDAPESVKSALHKQNVNHWLYYIAHFDAVVKSSYHQAHGITDWSVPAPADSVPHLEPMHYLAVAKAVDLGSDKYDYFITSSENDLASEIDWEDMGLESPRLKAIYVSEKLWGKAENGEIDEYDLQKIADCDMPLYTQAIKDTNAETLKKLESIDMSTAREMPDLPAEEAIKAITAEHAGKVVIIDVWNTWCQPCQYAIAQNEPLKSGELADEDLVWIYIADETSGKVAYYSQIPNIKGIHYRQSKAQFNALREKYGIDGIPSYILVDRKGNISLRNDLRNHSKFVKTLREELDKK